MEQRSIVAEVRTKTGANAGRQVRRAGRIPAVVYGRNPPVALSIDAHDFAVRFRTVPENEIIQLQIDSTKRDVLIKSFQSNLIKGVVTHIDFFEVDLAKTLKTHVPLHLVGTPKGVREGGVLETPTHEIEIECLPKDIPAMIEVDVAGLTAGHAIHVRDLPVPQTIKVLSNPDQVVAVITHAKAEVVVEDGDAEATPEAKAE